MSLTFSQPGPELRADRGGGGALQVEDTACCFFSWKGFSEPPCPPLSASTPSLFSLALGEGHVVSGSQAKGSEKCLGGVGGHRHLGGVAGRTPSSALPCIWSQSRLCVLLGLEGSQDQDSPGAERKMLFSGTWGASGLWCASRSCPGNSEAAAVRLAGVRRPRCSLRLPPAQHLSTGAASLAQDEVPICLLLLPAPPQGHSAGPLSARLPSLHSPLRCPSH